MTGPNSSAVRRDRGPLIAGVVLIVIGVVLLLEKLALLPPGFGWFHFWPVIFIIAGIVKVAYNDGRELGAALIGAGVLLQLRVMGIIHFNLWDLWPAVIILVGFAMLWQAFRREAEPNPADPHFDSVYIFGGTERRINTKHFKGGRLLAIFGGYKIDFERADMDGNEVVLDASAICGGGEIIVPEHWLVSIQGTAIFGGYEDKARHIQTDPSQPTKTLILKGHVIFGGISIKN
jgi:predicted membrane protein